jgi:hypothetical protein
MTACCPILHTSFVDTSAYIVASTTRRASRQSRADHRAAPFAAATNLSGSAATAVRANFRAAERVMKGCRSLRIALAIVTMFSASVWLSLLSLSVGSCSNRLPPERFLLQEALLCAPPPSSVPETPLLPPLATVLHAAAGDALPPIQLTGKGFSFLPSFDY